MSIFLIARYCQWSESYPQVQSFAPIHKYRLLYRSLVSVKIIFFSRFLSCAFDNMQICALVFLGAFLLLNFTDFTHMEKDRQKWRNLISKWRARLKQQVWTGHHSSPSPSSPSSSPPSDGESDAGGKLGLEECDHPRIWHFCKVSSHHQSSSLGFWPCAALS